MKIFYTNDGTWGVYKDQWMPVAWFVEEQDAIDYVKWVLKDEE